MMRFLGKKLYKQLGEHLYLLFHAACDAHVALRNQMLRCYCSLLQTTSKLPTLCNVRLAFKWGRAKPLARQKPPFFPSRKLQMRVFCLLRHASAEAWQSNRGWHLWCAGRRMIQYASPRQSCHRRSDSSEKRAHHRVTGDPGSARKIEMRVPSKRLTSNGYFLPDAILLFASSLEVFYRNLSPFGNPPKQPEVYLTYCSM